MRSILEQAVIHHLNNEADKAQDLFHQFIVSRARQIHESMRNGEDPLAEGWDQVTAEEYFNESELDELEDLEDDNVDGDDFGDADLDTDIDGVGGDEAAADELGDELGVDGDEVADDHAEDFGEEALDDTAELEARVEDLEAELERLVAQFDDAEGIDGEEAEEIEDDMSGVDASAEFGDEDAGDEEGFKMESEEEDDDEFEGLAEGDQAKLEPVSAKNAEGTEVGAGSKISGNDKSGLPQKNVASRQGGEPVKIKSSTHKGFERETAPAVASMKARKNNVDKADSSRSPVAAPSNKEEAKNTKSPIVPTKGLTK